MSAKLPVLKDQGVCWNDDVNDGWDGGGVVGCSMGFVRATRSNIAVHISASSAFVRTSFMRWAIYSIFSVFEVIWTIRLEMSPMRGPFPIRERRNRAAVRFCNAEMNLRTMFLPGNPSAMHLKA